VGFIGGNRAERAQVRQALAASSFDWGLLPGTVVVHISPLEAGGYAIPGNVFLDSGLLDAGDFSWGVVQHEFGHQVDFLLLHDDDRSTLERVLGTNTWCEETAGFKHSDQGCERFASELAWSYWPSQQNSMRPESVGDESGAMAPDAFRALVAALLPTPGLSKLRPVTAWAPPPVRDPARRR
jgi:hypothetical protein